MQRNNLVILAGGKATRFGDICQNKPKTLLKIDGQTILDRQLDTLGGLGPAQIIISTNTEKNRAQIKASLKSTTDTIVVTNKQHINGTIWALAEIANKFKLESFIFSFSDIYYCKNFFRALPNELHGPWIAGLHTKSKKRIKSGGIAAIFENNVTDIYYKIVPEQITEGIAWSGLTYFTLKEITLLNQYIKSVQKDTAEEDFINYCIKNGSQFKVLKTNNFININTPEDLEQARREK